MESFLFYYIGTTLLLWLASKKGFLFSFLTFTALVIGLAILTVLGAIIVFGMMTNAMNP